MNWILSLFVNEAHAQCPICVATVGVGLVLAEKLGIDPLLMAIWISGLNGVVAFWIATKFKKPILNSGVAWSIAFYLTTIAYLYYTYQLGTGMKLWGVDKVLLGLTLGMFVIFGAVGLDKYLRSRNDGKVFVPYQKVIIPLMLLILFTLVFKFII